MSFDLKRAVVRSILIQTSAPRVWKVLTDPMLIQQYLFGARTDTDWKVGSPIVFHGEFQGTRWQDKGVIQTFEPPRILRYSYWSGFCGLDDRPENYGVVTYTLVERDGSTELTVTQHGYASDESRTNSEQGWNAILGEIRRIAETFT